MTTRSRQETAGATTGMAFVDCGLKGAGPAEAGGRRREVVVNGRRVRTVDVHAHCAVPEAMALMGLTLGSPTFPAVLHIASVEARLRAMDGQGIDVEALSINPYWYGADRDVAGEIVRLQNEKLAGACAAHPDRFVAFATVACSTRTSRPGSSRRASRRTACGALPSAAASTARSWPIRGFIRSGPGPSSSAC